jgi:ATP-dependent HslUV protease ATP-binding subunit HslU
MSSVIAGKTPKEIVEELDKFIIGQVKAKKTVAIALRNRMRRACLPDEIRDEVAPKNIIMIGPTGVGKTEIARRLARLAGAPFLKVEATKFTEVGYVGRDVESMVRDLMAAAVSMVKSDMKQGVEKEARLATEDALLDLLLPKTRKVVHPDINSEETLPIPAQEASHARDVLREKLRAGELDDKKVEIKVSQNQSPMLEIFSGSGMESMDLNFGAFSNLMKGGRKTRKVTVAQARDLLFAEQTDKLIDNDNAVDIARDLVQNMGIIFIDEIDKIAVRGGKGGGPDVSREGVQRDILPIVEGSTVHTKYGMIDTSHILFIAAGAFSMSKPSDLIPELQGRFPLRVELEDLDADAFEQILTTPRNALITQYRELLKTEGVEVDFTPEAVRKIAETAADVNSRTENIGARRLHTIMELLLEELSYTASDRRGEKVSITAEYVDDKLSAVVQDRDLSRYIL